jgi:pyrophosphatase PpaX
LRSGRYQAVLFDLDGTLIDTASLIYASYRHAVHAILGYVPTDEQIHATMGETLFVGMQRFSVAQAVELTRVYREYNIAHHHEYVTSFPGAAATLRQLRLTGHKLGIVTSKRRDVAMLGLQQTRLAGYFDAIIAEDDAPVHKPHPYPIWRACKYLGVTAYDSIYVGDSAADMMAGKAAGCTVAGVEWSKLTVDELKLSGAHCILRTLQDLLRMEESAPEGVSLS